MNKRKKKGEKIKKKSQIIVEKGDDKGGETGIGEENMRLKEEVDSGRGVKGCDVTKEGKRHE